MTKAENVKEKEDKSTALLKGIDDWPSCPKLALGTCQQQGPGRAEMGGGGFGEEGWGGRRSYL